MRSSASLLIFSSFVVSLDLTFIPLTFGLFQIFSAKISSIKTEINTETGHPRLIPLSILKNRVFQPLLNIQQEQFAYKVFIHDK